MKITLLDSATVPHGAAFWARGMAEQLARRGHRVSLLCPSRSPLREPPPRFGAALRPLPLRNNYDLIAVAAIRRHLIREHAELFLFQGTRGMRLGAMAARLSGVPGVARAGSGEGLKATRYDRWLCRHAITHFIANAAWIEEELSALPWIGPGRVSLIYNGLDLERLQPAGDRSLRRELAIPDEAPVIAVVARLQALKGHEDLLRCLPELWEPFPLLHLLIAGQGPHEAHLRAVARELEAGDRVRFLGYRPDVRPVMDAADLLVQPSHREGLPNAVLEAMAMGLPVVATAAGGTGEVVRDEETGLLVPPGHPAALGAAVLRLLAEEGLRERLVDSARRRLEEQFSLSRSVDQIEALAERLSRAAPPRAKKTSPL
jgi:glycosyltransferase involved in cell wall biosynthesis